MTRSHRPGFSMIQLLAIMALLGLGVGLSIPLVGKARIRAERAQSLNHLRQLGIACHAYNDQMGHFPTGNDANNFSAAAHLLPFLEQQNLYKQIDFKKPMTDKTNEEARKALVLVFVNPKDPQKTVTDKSGPTNYLFSAGSKAELADNDGVFYQNSKIRLPVDIPDGTSNTLMIGETLKGDGGTKAVDVRRQYVRLPAKAVKEGLKDETGVDDWKDNKNIAGDRCASWMDGRFLQGTFTSTRLPNDPRPDVSFDGLGGLSALRSRDGYVTILNCDGAAHVLRIEGLSRDTWKYLASRNDGQVLGADYFDVLGN